MRLYGDFDKGIDDDRRIALGFELANSDVCCFMKPIDLGLSREQDRSFSGSSTIVKRTCNKD